jgi:RNA polymerase sigma-70 factor (ECF subfamily)
MGPANNHHWRAFCADPQQDSFLPVYVLTKTRVWSVSRRILGEEEESREAFLAAYRELLIEAPMEARSGLYPVAFRLAVAEARRARRRLPWRFGPAVRGGEREGIERAPEAPARTMARCRIRDRLEDLLAELPDRLRVPMLLHYFHGMSDWEIAQSIGLPERKVIRATDRGRARLQGLLEREGMDPEAPLLESVFASSWAESPPADLDGPAVFARAQAAMVTRSAMVEGPPAGAAAKWIGAGVAICGLLALLALRLHAEAEPSVRATTPSSESAPAEPVAAPSNASSAGAGSRSGSRF